METPKNKGKGRPTVMTNAMKDKVIKLISSSTKTIREISKSLKINPDTIYSALGNDSNFSERYARAKEQQATIFADNLIDVARRKSKDSVDAYDKRIEIDTIKWALSKTLPKKYGNHNQVVLQGQDPEEIAAPIMIKAETNATINIQKVPTEMLENLLQYQKPEEDE